MQTPHAGEGQTGHEQKRRVGNQQHAQVAHGQGIDERHAVEHELASGAASAMVTIEASTLTVNKMLSKPPHAYPKAN